MEPKVLVKPGGGHEAANGEGAGGRAVRGQSVRAPSGPPAIRSERPLPVVVSTLKCNPKRMFVYFNVETNIRNKNTCLFLYFNVEIRNRPCPERTCARSETTPNLPTKITPTKIC